VQIVAETFLADDDHGFQFEPMAFGSKPLGLCAGQSHLIRSVTEDFRLKDAHGITASPWFPCQLQDGPALGQDAGYVTI